MRSYLKVLKMSDEDVLEKGCEIGNLEDVKRAIASGVDPKLPLLLKYQFRIETPLHIACRYVP